MADAKTEETVDVNKSTNIPTSLGRDAAVGFRLGNSTEGGVICRGTSVPQRRPGAYTVD